MKQGESRLWGYGGDGGQQAAVFLVGQAHVTPRRLWMLPLFLFLLTLAPLMRWGIPLTQAGILLLHPELAREVLPPLLTGLSPGSELGYKLSVALTLAVASGAVWWMAGRLWGRHVAWWVTALWLTSPVIPALLYQWGWLHLLRGVALVAVGFAVLLGAGRGLRWLGAAPLILGVYFLLQWFPGIVPYDFLGGGWPEPTAAVEWLSDPGWNPGLVLLLLAITGGMMAWGRRHTGEGRKVLLLAGASTLALFATLPGGPLLLWLSIATLTLALAAGGLPALDPRYGTLPVLLAILILSALNVYPALRPAWLDEPPAAPLGTLFGEGQLLLLDAEQAQAAGVAVVTARWQVVGPVEQDLTAFVHFLDGGGEIIAQADTLLIDAEGIPSSRWPRGYLVEQQYQTTTPSPPVQLRLGLYDLATLERLPTSDGGDSVTIPVR